MNPRYMFEICDGISPYYYFAYFDTEEHLADFLFAHENVDVTIENEFAAEDDPYHIILCRVPKKNRDGFLRVIDLLPGLMAYVGRTDYDEFCLNMMIRATQYAKSKRMPGSRLPLQ